MTHDRPISKRLFRAFIAAAVAAVMALEPTLAAASQASLWSDRKARPGAGQIAALPAAAAQSILSGLPSTRRAISAPSIEATAATSRTESIPLSAQHLQIRSATSGTGRPILVLQDIHLNGEAQTNLAAALEKLVNDGKVSVIGVEGAFGEFDLEAFRAFPDRVLTRRIINDYLGQGLIGAPSAAAINAERAAPLYGVDDRALYDRNVAAYLAARRDMAASRASLASAREKLSSETVKLTGPQRAYLLAWTAYHDNGRPLAEHFKSLSSAGAVPTPQARAFLTASTLESSLNFAAVESERRAVIESLVSRIGPRDVESLTAWAVNYRQGLLSHAAFYARLDALCRRSGVDLSTKPSFSMYLSYVSLADSIDPEILFKDLRRMEALAWDALKPSREQSAVRERHELLSLEDRLIRFALTPDEWAQYQKLRKRHPSSLAGASSIEDFYASADERSERMVTNLLGRPGDGHRVLLVGGFHTPHVVELLRQRGLSSVVATPKLARVDLRSASAYLSVFAREKTPLEQWVRGEELHINPTVVGIGNTPESRAEGLGLKAILGGATAIAKETKALPAGTDVTVNKLSDGAATVSVASTGGSVDFEVGTRRGPETLRTADGYNLQASRPMSVSVVGSMVAGWLALLAAGATFIFGARLATVIALGELIGPGLANAAPWILMSVFATWSLLYFAQGGFMAMMARDEWNVMSLDKGFLAPDVIDISKASSVATLDDVAREQIAASFSPAQIAALEGVLTGGRVPPSFVINGRIFANRYYLARLPRFLQRSILWHERAHAKLRWFQNGPSVVRETPGYAAQALYFTIFAPFEPLWAVMRLFGHIILPEERPVPAPEPLDFTKPDDRNRAAAAEIEAIIAAQNFFKGERSDLYSQEKVAAKYLWSLRSQLTGTPVYVFTGTGPSDRDGLGDQTNWPPAVFNRDAVLAWIEQAVAGVPNDRDLPVNLNTERTGMTGEAVERERAWARENLPIFQSKFRAALIAQYEQLRRRADLAVAGTPEGLPARAEPAVKKSDVRWNWLGAVAVGIPLALWTMGVSIAAVLSTILLVIANAVWWLLKSPFVVIYRLGWFYGGGLTVAVGTAFAFGLTSSFMVAVIAAGGIVTAFAMAATARVSERRWFRARALAAILVVLSFFGGGRVLVENFFQPVVPPEVPGVVEPGDEEPVPPVRPGGKLPDAPQVAPEVVTLAKELDAMLASVRAERIPPGDPRVKALIRRAQESGLRDLAIMKAERDRRAQSIEDAAKLTERLNTNLYAAVVDPDGRVAMNGNVPALFASREELGGYLSQKLSGVRYYVQEGAVTELRRRGVNVDTDGFLKGGVADVDRINDINAELIAAKKGPYNIDIVIRKTPDEIQAAKNENDARVALGLEKLKEWDSYVVRLGFKASLDAGRASLTNEAARNAEVAQLKAKLAEDLKVPEKLPDPLTQGPVPNRLPGPVAPSPFNRNAGGTVMIAESVVDILTVLERAAVDREVRVRTGVDLNPSVPVDRIDSVIRNAKRVEEPFEMRFVQDPQRFIRRAADGNRDPDLVIGDQHRSKQEVPITGLGIRTPNTLPPVTASPQVAPIPAQPARGVALKVGERRLTLPILTPRADDPMRDISPVMKDGSKNTVTFEDGGRLALTPEVIDDLSNPARDGRSWVVLVDVATTRRFNPTAWEGKSDAGAGAAPLEIYIVSPDVHEKLGDPREIGAQILANGGFKVDSGGRASIQLTKRIADQRVAEQKALSASVLGRLDTTDDVLLLNADGTVFDGPEIHIEERMLELAAAGRVRIEWSPSDGKWEPISPRDYMYPSPNSRPATAIASKKGLRFVRIQDDKGVALAEPKTIFLPTQVRLIAFDSRGRLMSEEEARIADARGEPVSRYVDVAPDGRTAIPPSLSELRNPVFGTRYQERAKELRADGLVAKRLALRQAQRESRILIQRASADILGVHTVFVYDGPVNVENPLARIVGAVVDPNDVPRMMAGFPAEMQKQVRAVPVTDLVFHVGVAKSETGEDLPGTILRIENTKTGQSFRLFEGRETGRIDSASGGVEQTVDGRIERIYTVEEVIPYNDARAIQDFSGFLFGWNGLEDRQIYGTKGDYRSYSRRYRSSPVDGYEKGHQVPWDVSFYPDRHILGRGLPPTDVSTRFLEYRGIRPAVRLPGAQEWTPFPLTLGEMFVTWHASPFGMKSITPAGPADVIFLNRAFAKATHRPDPTSKLNFVYLMQGPAGNQVEIMPWERASPRNASARVKAFVKDGKMDAFYDARLWREMLERDDEFPRLPSASSPIGVGNVSVGEDGKMVYNRVVLRPTATLDALNATRASLFEKSMLTDVLAHNLKIDREIHSNEPTLFHILFPIREGALKLRIEQMDEAYLRITRPRPGEPFSGYPNFGIPKTLRDAVPDLGNNPYWMNLNPAAQDAYLYDVVPGYGGWLPFTRKVSGIWSDLTLHYQLDERNVEKRLGTPETVGSHLAFPLIGIRSTPSGVRNDSDILLGGRESAAVRAIFADPNLVPYGAYAKTPPVVGNDPGWMPPIIMVLSAPTEDRRAYRLSNEWQAMGAGTYTRTLANGVVGDPAFGYDLDPLHAAAQRQLMRSLRDLHAQGGGLVSKIHGGATGQRVVWRESSKKGTDGKPIFYPEVVPFVTAVSHPAATAILARQGLNEPYAGGPIRGSRKADDGTYEDITTNLDAGVEGAVNKAARLRAAIAEGEAMEKVRQNGRGYVAVTYTYSAEGKQTVTAEPKTGAEAEREYRAAHARLVADRVTSPMNPWDNSVTFTSGGKTWVVAGNRLTELDASGRPVSAMVLLPTVERAQAVADAVAAGEEYLKNRLRVLSEGGTIRYNEKTLAVEFTFGAESAETATKAMKAWVQTGPKDLVQSMSFSNAYMDGDVRVEVFASPAQLKIQPDLPLDGTLIPDSLKPRLLGEAVADNQKLFDALPEEKKDAARDSTRRQVAYALLTSRGSGGGAVVLTKDGRFDSIEMDAPADPKGTTATRLWNEAKERVGLEAIAVSARERSYISFKREDGRTVILVIDPDQMSQMVRLEQNEAASIDFVIGEFDSGRLPSNVNGVLREEFQLPTDVNSKDLVFRVRSLWNRLDAIPGAAPLRKDAATRDSMGFLSKTESADGVTLHYQLDDKDGVKGGRTLSLENGVTIQRPVVSMFNGKPVYEYDFEMYEREGKRGFVVTPKVTPTAPAWANPRPPATTYEIVTIKNPHGKDFKVARIVEENDGILRSRHGYNEAGDRVSTTTDILGTDGKTWRSYSRGEAVLTAGRRGLDGSARTQWKTTYAADNRVVTDTYGIDGTLLESVSGTQKNAYFDVRRTPDGKEYAATTLVLENERPVAILRTSFSMATGEKTVDRYTIVPSQANTFPSESVTVDGATYNVIPVTREAINVLGYVRHRTDIVRQPVLDVPNTYRIVRPATTLDVDKAERARRDTAIAGLEMPIETQVDGRAARTYKADPITGDKEKHGPSVVDGETVLEVKTAIPAHHMAEVRRQIMGSEPEIINGEKNPTFIARKNQADRMETAAMTRQYAMRKMSFDGKEDSRLRIVRMVDASGIETRFFYEVGNAGGLASRTEKWVPSSDGKTMRLESVTVLTDAQADPANPATMMVVNPKTGAPTGSTPRPDPATGLFRMYRIIFDGNREVPAGFSYMDLLGNPRGTTGAGLVTDAINPAVHPLTGLAGATESRELNGGRRTREIIETDPVTGVSRTATIPINPPVTTFPTETLRPATSGDADPFSQKTGGMIPIFYTIFDFFGLKYANYAIAVETILFGALAVLSPNAAVWIGLNALFVLLHFTRSAVMTRDGYAPTVRGAALIALGHLVAIALTRAVFAGLDGGIAIPLVVALAAVAAAAWSGVIALHLRINRGNVAPADPVAARNLERILTGAGLNLDISSLRDADRTGFVETNLSEAFAQRVASSLDAGDRDGFVRERLPLWTATGQAVREAVVGRSDGLFAGSLGAAYVDARLNATTVGDKEARATVPVQFVDSEDEEAAVSRGTAAMNKLFGEDGNPGEKGLVLRVRSAAAAARLRDQAASRYGGNVLVLDWSDDGTAGTFLDLDAAVRSSSLADLWSRAEIRLFLPPGLNLSDDFFVGTPDDVRQRVRQFLVIYRALNAVAIETRSLDDFDDIARIVLSQA